MPDLKKFLDQNGVGYLYGKVKAEINTVDGKVTALDTKVDSAVDALEEADTAINNKIGTVAAGKTVVEMIADAQTAATYDDTALANRVTANESAITLLNKTDGTAGSVKKTVDDAIAAVVASAPESFDTLKEISDWISGHSSDASAMNSDIAALKLKTELGLDENDEEYATVKDYVEAEIAKVDGAASTLAGRVSTAEGKITTLEGKMTTAEDDIDALETLVGSTAVSTQISNAIDALGGSASQTAGADGLALSVTSENGEVKTISGSIAANTYDAYGSAAAVLGASTDTATANTVYGAKALANDVYAAIQSLSNSEIQAAIDAANA